jgi:hypothetical protein
MTHPLASKGLPRAGRAVGRWAAALVLPALMACSDGYPTEDVPQIDPARMTQAQLLAALNDLGKEPHLGKRWRYQLHAGCELEIVVRDGERERRRVVLEGATIATRSDDGVTEIRLVPRAGGEAQAVTALETRRWSDTVRARAMLTQLELRCDPPAPPAA